MEVINEFSLMDWVIIGLLFCGIILGYVRGFISQLVSIAGLFIAYIAAYFFYDDLAPWIAKLIPITKWENYEKYELLFNNFNLDVYFYNIIAFAVIFFTAKIILSILGHFFNLVAKVPGLNMINKWSGAFLGLLEVIVLIIVAVHVMAIIPSEPVQQLAADSYISNFIHEQMPAFAEKFNSLLEQEG